MFDFILMAGNYDTRKVARYEEGDVFVSTAAVSDSTHPYETAVGHPDYNDGKLIIVEIYGDRASAVTGHEKWVATMTSDELPEVLGDVASTGEGSDLGAFVAGLGAPMLFPRKPKP